ncbi:hypothetical protein LAV73_21965 [Lysinibacillus xylanilyticus]|uniref:hypothetical protein n=1 Tax=Lysinibacillus xylanilyticus TaxID=582475 RepID=UPI002B245044|nr:hypothetical protein [Lysinibacillus xylanilyticus]MEB2282597.1 hypothetical protein [Lysinibacillus xylanilyticus]
MAEGLSAAYTKFVEERLYAIYKSNIGVTVLMEIYNAVEEIFLDQFVNLEKEAQEEIKENLVNKIHQNLLKIDKVVYQTAMADAYELHRDLSKYSIR